MEPVELNPESADRKFANYKVIRDEIVHEDNLMSNRLNWFTASQSFLLTALSIANKGDHVPTAATDYLFPLVPIIAIASCLLIWFGVLAGLVVLRRWRSQLRALSRTPEDPPHIGSDNVIIIFGWSAPVLLPVVFLVAWIYLLTRGCTG